MTAETLVELSGIKNQPNFHTFDYALPMNNDGSYPYDGKAISVYWDKRIFSEAVSYHELALMALDNNPPEHAKNQLKEIAAQTAENP
jgi:hypothetical protein